MTESQLQEAVAGYLVTKYPDVMFHSDFGSGTKLTPTQAARQKRQNGYRKGWPDLFIAEVVEARPVFEEPYWNNICRDWDCFFGLFLELKKSGTRLKKKNGEWATEHIAEQAKVLEKLRQRGYCAEFAVGFDEAKKIIDEYLGDK